MMANLPVDTLSFYDLSVPLPRNWWGNNAPRPPIAKDKAQERAFKKARQEWLAAKKLRETSKFPQGNLHTSLSKKLESKMCVLDDDCDENVALDMAARYARRAGGPKRRWWHAESKGKGRCGGKRTKTEHVTFSPDVQRIVYHDDNHSDVEIHERTESGIDESEWDFCVDAFEQAADAPVCNGACVKA